VQHAQDLPFGRIKPNGSSCHPSWSRNNFKCETEDHHTSSYSLNCPPPKTKGCSWPICICYMGCLVIPLPLLLSSSFNLFPFKCKTEDQHTSSCSLDCLPPKTKGCSWPICIRYAGCPVICLPLLLFYFLSVFSPSQIFKGLCISSVARARQHKPLHTNAIRLTVV
jgi:hypothetical protein